MSRGIGVLQALQDAVPPVLIPVFVAITTLGSVGFLLVVLSLLYWLDDRERGAYVLSVALGGLALTLVLKTFFALPRPPRGLHLIHASGYGFPSGHAIESTVVYGTLAVVLDIGTRRTRAVGAAGLVALIALSRIVLGVHYAVDVIVGVGVGVSFLVTVLVLTRRAARRGFWLAVVVAVLGIVLTGGNREGVAASAGTLGAALTWEWERLMSRTHLYSKLAGVEIIGLGLPFVALLGYVGFSEQFSLPVVLLANVLLSVSVLSLPVVIEPKSTHGSDPANRDDEETTESEESL